jgi:tetratricopeptide (TPR) repeat protein
MSARLEQDSERSPATAGDIAVINLQSTREGAWNRFWHTPERPGLAEYIVEQEGLVLAFLGDCSALDRMTLLAEQLARTGGDPIRSVLLQAQVASVAHRFADARQYLARARSAGVPAATTERLSLGVDQACGTRLDAVLAARRRIAAQTGHLEDLVPLGSLLAELGHFDEADQVYRDALRGYQDVSPFALAWVCFQLGLLWGELVPERQSARSALWYRKAVTYLPAYVRARVHLAEIYMDSGRYDAAEALLIPVASSGDPEVLWRLADVSAALERDADAVNYLESARLGFESLLGKHLLAFADHGAAFYAGSGNDPERALELAGINAANRPTARAIAQTHAAASAVQAVRGKT